MTYRPELDGVRAAAVLLVVLYHLGVAPVSGGYVGVDVFFVVSGYLITTLLRRDLAAGTFSFARFYLRRLVRLGPALAAVTAATFAGAALTLSAGDFAAFARSAAAAVVSVSNILFFLEAGYWDRASELKPLLHTWSLGVEEQFYLVWPVLIAGLAVSPLRARPGLVFAAVFVAGAALAAWMTRASPEAAFFLTPFRIFQFALGALAGRLVEAAWAARLPAAARDGLAAAGLGGVLAAAVLFDSGTAFPGVAALLPTLATGALILAVATPAGAGPASRAVLANPVALWIGKASYALYLVHWPIIVLHRYRTGLDLSPAEQIGLGLAALAAGAALHYGVERRFYARAGWRSRSGEAPRRRRAGLALAAIPVAVVGLSLHAGAGDGWAWRFPEVRYTEAEIEAGKGARFAGERFGCRVDRFPDHPACRPEASLQVLFFGNSHEPDAVNFVAGGWGERRDLNLISFGTVNQCDGIAPAETGGFTAGRADCAARLSAMFDPDLLSRLDVVVYAAHRPFGANKGEMLAVLQALKAERPDLRVVTLGGFLQLDAECARLVNETGRPEACFDPARLRWFDADDADPMRDAFLALSDHYVDRASVLCRDERPESCLAVSPEGEPVAWDAHHMTRTYAEMAGRLYAARHPGLLDGEPGS